MGDQPLQRGIGQMKRLLILIALIITFVPNIQSQAQTAGGFCEDYSYTNGFISKWNRDTGTAYADFYQSAYRTVSKQQIVVAWKRGDDIAKAGEITLEIQPVTPISISPTPTPGPYIYNTNPFLITIE